MKTKLLVILVCLFMYIPASHSQCTAIPNQNTIGGTVFNDADQNGVLNGIDSGVNNISIDLHQDNNGNGIIDSDDSIVSNTTSNGTGYYSFDLPQVNFEENVLDNFNTPSWAGNNGSENWSNDWQEIGESDGVSSGNIRVTTALRFGSRSGDDDTEVSMNGDGAYRIADLSTYTSASLSFSFNKQTGSGDPDDGRDFSVNVQVSTDGVTYTTLDNLSFTDTAQNYTYDISAYAAVATHVRFISTGFRLGLSNYLLFDDVEIAYTKPGNYYPNYIVSINASTIPTNSALTTVSHYPVAYSGLGQVSCNNDFGLYNCGGLCPPDAEDDSETILRGESVSIAVLTNDSDGNNNIDTSSLSITTAPNNGSVSLDGSGNIIYSPSGSYIGVDTFVYQICDTTSLCDTATVTITILDNFTDPCVQAAQEQTYFVPFPDNELRTGLSNASGSCGDGIPVTDNINRIVSIKTPYPGSIITYDHWEDGYEVDINNPVQPTTQVWGDEDVTNGTSPVYSDDYIPSGGNIVLKNTYNYNPRNPSEIVYDGKDKIHTTNDVALSVIAGDINRFDIQLAKTDVYSMDKFGTSFVVPYGEDLGQEFLYTGLYIRASANGTTVNIDLDNSGTIDTTAGLNEGEVMFVDGNVNSGAIITSNLPVGVDLFFGGENCFGTRQINLLPGKFYSDTYYSPVPTTNSSAPSVVYFYNSLNRSITINWESNANTGNIIIAANSSASLSLSDDSGYKFTSSGGESYVASQVIDADSNGSRYDWAFNLISEERLTDFAAIAWAPGTQDFSDNFNPVWVTPTANTTLYIKHDGDLTDAAASMSPCGIPYDEFITLNALDYAKIFDTFNNDNDQSGMALYTCDGTKLFAVYGEDPSLATTSGSGSLDVGTSMQPLCLKALVFANDDVAYGITDTPIDVSVLNNDSSFLTNINPSSVTTNGLLQPQNGQLIVNPSGTITYIPDPGFIGVDTFEYTVCSLEFPGTCDSATITIYISNCPTPTNRNMIYGQVYYDVNEDLINNDGIGFENFDINIYNDVNADGAVDGGDILLQTTTTNFDGFYNYEVPIFNRVISDDFSSENYSGGTGWNGNWIEVGDNNNPGSGTIRIEELQPNEFELRLRSNDYIYRALDLSGITSANISFEVKEFGSLEDADIATVQICSNDTFTNCQTLFLGTNDFISGSINGTVIEPDKLTSTAVFRAIVSGFTASSELFYVDDIIVRYEEGIENLVMETESSSIPVGYTFSTDNVEVAQFAPGSFGTCETDNDFGLLRCNLIDAGIDVICDNNGTLFESSDDFYSITINPTGVRLGTTYTISGDITATGTYGVPQTFGPYPATSANKTITINDSTGNCSLVDVLIDVSVSHCLFSDSSIAIDFDGVDDHIITDSFVEGYTNATLMAWINPDVAFSGAADIAGQSMFRLQIASNGRFTTHLRIDGNVNAFDIPSSVTIQNNVWTHVAATYDGALGTLKLYVDGEEVEVFSNSDIQGMLSTNLDPNGDLLSTDFSIGNFVGNNNRFFMGSIDEVRVFDLTLTEDQIQKMVNQEIEEISGTVGGKVVPKSINDSNTNATIPWANLQAYYPMTDIMDGYTDDKSSNTRNARLINITTLQEQTAPMPYITIAGGDGNWENPSNWLYGNVWKLPSVTINKTIVRITNDIDLNETLSLLGLVIDNSNKLTVTGDNAITNNWYLQLDGTIDLQNDSQLIQTINSDLVTSATGRILRRQEGVANPYWYNYWSSPVGVTGATSLLNNNTNSNNPNNSPFNIQMLKDESGAGVLFTTGYTGSGSISTYWLYNFINGTTYWDWARIGTSNPLNPGIGYTQKGTGVGGSEQQYIFEGKPNNGTILIDVLDTGGAGSVPTVSKTDYLLGNPYSSAIDIHKFIDDNVGVIGGYIQLWQQWAGDSHNLREYQGGYAKVNKTGSIRASQFISFYGADTGLEEGTVLPTRYLPVGQGFMAEIIADGQVEFNNSQRIFIKEADADGSDDTGSHFLKSAGSKDKKGNQKKSEEDNESNTMQKIRLEFSSTSGPETRHELLLGFSDYTTDGYDYGYDAKKAATSNNTLSLALADEQMSIQAYAPISNDKVVPLNFSSSGDNGFEIRISKLKNIDDTQAIYLRDNVTGTYFNLREDLAYSFTSTQGVFNNRFEIVFQSEQQSLSAEDALTTENHMYYKNATNTLYVKKLSSNVRKLSLVNMRGQIILEKTNVSRTILENGIQFDNVSTGVYVVSMKTDMNEVLTKKIIIR